MVYKRPSLEPAAVVGSSCRFAGGATSPAKLWEVLCEVPDLSREVPPERFNAAAFYHPDGEYHGTTNSVKAYWLQQDHRAFDAGMFNITPKEAEAIDPQQRMVLEVVYEAMESAGYTLETYNGKDVSVFSGVMTADHDVLSQRDELSTSQYYATGNARSIISNRVSYFFNFQGPSMTIDTACSSSLVALHQAILSLRSGESIMACVTGVNLMLTPEQFLVESSLHMLSPTGKSRMWDASADGYARGEGVAALLLKPLSRALADGDQIMAIVRHTGTNSDGRTKGITLPNPKAQSSLIKETYRKTGLDSTKSEDRCQYFEAHGTGTPAGDPREAEAICNAFFDPGTSETPASATNNLLVGSSKTVLGHTEGAAGLAGLLKVIQAMKHGLVPPNLHFNSINPNVEPFYTRLEIPTSLVPWPQPSIGQPKRASINSFGFGGANAHAIVESYEPHIHDAIYRQHTIEDKDGGPQHQHEPNDTCLYLPLLLSAASQVSLRAVASSYRGYLLQHPDVGHDQLAWAVFSRRTALPYRLALSASSRSQILDILGGILDESSSPKNTGTRNRTVNGRPKFLGVFTGQGAQWVTMSRSLFRSNEVYRNTIRNLDQILRSCPRPPEWTLEGQILADGSASLVNIAAVSQPLCTAVQLGLVDLLKSLNIGFHTVIGHSSGEIAAAYAAERISARDAILISYYRGYLAHLAGSPEGQRGGMLAAGISEEEAFKFCETPAFSGRLYVAASNAPSSVTLSGDLDAIKEAHEELTKERSFSRILKVDSAYHSPHMAGPAVEYIASIRAIGVKPDRQGNGVVWVSSVHGKTMSEDEKLDAEYWRDNMVNMVRFRDAVTNAISQYGPFDTVIEVGPHPALRGPFTQTAKSLGHDLRYSSPLNRTQDETLAFSDFLGGLWSSYGPREISLGKYIEQSPSLAVLNTCIADLPTYPWDHSQLHYRESRISRQFHFKAAPPHELLGVRTRDDNEHEMRWRNLIKLDKLPWVEHHSFQGHALLPASAYCIMALDAARHLLKESASMVELQDVQIVSGINVERDSVGTEVLFTLTVLPQGGAYDNDVTIEAGFTLASCPADGTTAMRKNMTGRLKIYLGEPTLDALPPRHPSESEAFHATPESFYDMMEETGLNYTGPFRALESIKRRYNYCSATLKRRHPEDSTTLQISPATLDSCFQSAFLTYAFPGDRSLWTSFLPICIDRIRFNLAPRKGDSLIVDTHMVDIQPATTDSKTKFFVDLGIFNGDGDMEIQVEGLTVAALAHTLPKDDYELYLNTVFDIDPTDEIVQVDVPSSAVVDPVLIEDCARVATFFVRSSPGTDGLSLDLSSYYEKLASWFPEVLGTIGADYWRLDTKKAIGDLIQGSDYRDSLNLVRELDSHRPDFVADVLRILIEETHHLSRASRHVGRIARQIAHRYPRMNILSLTRSEPEFLADVLHSIGHAFSSCTVGVETLPYPGQDIPMGDGLRERIVPLSLDLTRDLRDQLGHENPYDLALLSASELDNSYALSTLKYLREIMRPGGFLIVIQSPRSPTKSRLLRISEDQHDEDRASTPPQWPDVLDTYGFIQVAKHCDQSFLAGYSVMVRQVSSPELLAVKQPSRTAGNSVTDHLLIIGGSDGSSNGLVHQLEQRLLNLCRKLTVRATFDEVNPEILNACTAAIVLADVERPLMANMTQETLDKLRDLMRPEMKILWLTAQALTGNPDNAATFGFTRTVSAEVPGLVLQILDIEDIGVSGDLVADHFICLVKAGKSEGLSLWTDEREVHIKDGRRLIPRILPLQELNDSMNSLRRVVTNSVNSLREPAEIIPCLSSGRLVRYEARRGCSSPRDYSAGQIQIYVDYSSVEALGLNTEESGRANDPCLAYICFGVDRSTGEGVVAMSRSNASSLSLPREQVYPVGTTRDIGLPLIYLVARYVVAERIAKQAVGQSIILIDSDPVFTQCVVECVSDYKRGTPVISYSTTPVGEGNGYATKFLHRRASARDIKAIFPPKGAVVFDFQPAKHAMLSEQILGLLPANCKYHRRPALFNSCGPLNGRDCRGEAGWKGAVLKALRSDLTSLRSRAEFDTPSQSSLLLDVESASSPFCLVDWRADRNATCIAKHQTREGMFRSDRTYVLVGITKDFGQSLCYLLVKHGARNIVLASRDPKTDSNWIGELSQAYGANIKMRKCDVTDLASVETLKLDLSGSMPPVAGIVNGAMVLDDRVFAQMNLDTWERVMRPKTVGSRNLDIAFRDSNLEFFIMTSSFAAIGGHPGQANYAAANMYMNGLVGVRRSRGQAASVLNIGVIYGLGFLLREKEELYAGLEREGYPPISEHDIHHMFLEAVAAGRPEGASELPIDITTGLRRFDPTDPNPLLWHRDPRFSHYSRHDSEESSTAAEDTRKNLKDHIAALAEPAAITQTILEAFTERLHTLLQLPKEAIHAAQTMSELGVDSLAAVEVRSWIFKTVGKDVSVIQLLGGISIQKLCADLAEQIIADREKTGDGNTQ